MRAVSLDHIVLLSDDIERALAWWRDVLGAPLERVEEWRAGEVPFPSVRLSPDTLVDLVPGPRTGENLAHVAVAVDPEGEDLADFAARHGLTVVDGPRRLWGAHGTGVGIYVRDPDDNVIELRTYADVSAVSPARTS